MSNITVEVESDVVNVTMDDDPTVFTVQIGGPTGTSGSGGYYRHEQASASDEWVIEHGLSQPISACHIVCDGAQVLAPWVEDEGSVTISFGKPYTGYAVLS
ncbi:MULTISPECIES: hypothetical protein [unclassified Mycobacteroides]|jgi:hypothetical protein|uniref:hypothetical protein n=1 Tax=unclassified Mycobacteroides TaxID=2618759 RepID=UPI000715F118|nr:MULTISPECIES: hypothetical protein [unclassified Mycobacteroides]KRQ27186.1 hypothetical protein AOT87_04400 [Mycobacteroides sp. H003]KRQ32504.1 hypothetical protein AOT91_11460 [Mycobacteroides sp. H092]KRQ42150.1 hypothetical protein AOT88_25645 [Mycobacteroides sp. H063]KRQ54386.1 hypothetical protein AOT94_22910 [Mycobacteroides sp. HXVII]KRQ62247.1 hypothetical protein AOT90_15340 [Mycobacteroides sp. H079]